MCILLYDIILSRFFHDVACVMWFVTPESRDVTVTYDIILTSNSPKIKVKVKELWKEIKSTIFNSNNIVYISLSKVQ